MPVIEIKEGCRVKTADGMISAVKGQQCEVDDAQARLLFGMGKAVPAAEKPAKLKNKKQKGLNTRDAE